MFRISRTDAETIQQACQCLLDMYDMGFVEEKAFHDAVSIMERVTKNGKDFFFRGKNEAGQVGATANN